MRLILNYSQYIAVSEYASGYENGYEIGYEIGYESGYEKGVYEEKIKAVKKLFRNESAVEDVQKMYPDLNTKFLDYLKSESDSSKSE